MRITVEEAAKMIGVSPQGVRVQMDKKIIDIGYVAGTKKRKEYIIFKEKVEKLING